MMLEYDDLSFSDRKKHIAFVESALWTDWSEGELTLASEFVFYGLLAQTWHNPSH